MIIFILLIMNIKNISIRIILICLTIYSTIQQPQKIGLLTVTYARDNNFSVFMNFIQRYPQMPCYTDIISEINVVWNNQKAPETVGAFVRQKLWKIPVNFLLNQKNSLNNRFTLPNNSQATILYSLDDDIIVDCNTLHQSYLKYHGQSNIKPRKIISNEVRAYQFIPYKKITEFNYDGRKDAEYFAFGQTGASFYPKQYLHLYYLNLPELQYLRKIVQKITSCQDIFFMSIVQHFYPQIYHQFSPPSQQFSNTDPQFGLSKNSKVYKLRNQCLTQLVVKFGYLPLRLIHKKYTKYKNNWQYQNLKEIMMLKTSGIETLDNHTQINKEGLHLQKSQKPIDEQKEDEIQHQEVEQKLLNQEQADKLVNSQGQDHNDPAQDESSNTIARFWHKIIKNYQFLLILILLIGIVFLLVIIFKMFKEYYQLKQQEGAQYFKRKVNLGVGLPQYTQQAQQLSKMSRQQDKQSFN